MSDPLYATDQSRGDHSAAILERMRAWCATRTTAEALAQLTAAGLPAGPVLSPQQALDDPQVAAMKFLTEVAGYPGLGRAAQVPGLPVAFSRLTGGITSAPPRSGEHSGEILEGIGYSAAEIEALTAAGVIA